MMCMHYSGAHVRMHSARLVSTSFSGVGRSDVKNMRKAFPSVPVSEFLAEFRQQICLLGLPGMVYRPLGVLLTVLGYSWRACSNPPSGIAICQRHSSFLRLPTSFLSFPLPAFLLHFVFLLFSCSAGARSWASCSLPLRRRVRMMGRVAPIAF